MTARREIALDDALPFEPGDALLVQLTPRVHARVVDRAAVVRVRRDFAIDVIVAQRDVVPPRRVQLGLWNLDRRAVGRRGTVGQRALNLAVQHEHVEPRGGIRGERRNFDAVHVGDREDRELSVRKREALRFAVDDVHAQLREQRKDAARLGGARRVVIARDEDDRRVRQLAHESRELQKGEEDRLVRRPHGVKHVAGDEHHIGR